MSDDHITLPRNAVPTIIETDMAIIHCLETSDTPLNITTIAGSIGRSRNHVSERVHTLEEAGVVRTETASKYRQTKVRMEELPP